MLISVCLWVISIFAITTAITHHKKAPTVFNYCIAVQLTASLVVPLFILLKDNHEMNEVYKLQNLIETRIAFDEDFFGSSEYVSYAKKYNAQVDDLLSYSDGDSFLTFYDLSGFYYLPVPPEHYTYTIKPL